MYTNHYDLIDLDSGVLNKCQVANFNLFLAKIGVQRLTENAHGDNNQGAL